MAHNVHIPVSDAMAARIRVLHVRMNKRYVYDTELAIIEAGVEALEKKFAPAAQKVQVTLVPVDESKPVKPT